LKYKILDAPYMWTLMEDVNKHMEGGWKPQGGVHYWAMGIHDKYMQAMVKE
jgi:hypothetical protein